MEDTIKRVIVQMVSDGELRIELHHESGFYYPDVNELRLVAQIDGENEEYNGFETKDILRNV